MILVTAGILLLALVCRDLFQTVAWARGSAARGRIAALLIRDAVWPLWRGLGQTVRSASLREDLLAIFAPFALLLLFTCWISLLVLAYSLILFGMRGQFWPHFGSLADAVYVSALSVATMGGSKSLYLSRWLQGLLN